MTQATGAEAARDTEFFRDLPQQYIERLEALGRPIRFERDQIIFREGEPHGSLYLILTGSVSLEVTAPGRTLRVLTINKGEEFGWSSILPSHGKHFQARALSNVQALVFDAAGISQVCEAEPEFGYALMKRLLVSVSDRLDAVRVQLLDLYSAGEK